MNDVLSIYYPKFIPIYYKKSIIRLLCHHINSESLRISINSFGKYIGLKEINQLLVNLVLVCKDWFTYISKLIYVYVSPPPISIPTSIHHCRFTLTKHVSIYKKSSIKILVINLMKTPSRSQQQPQSQQQQKNSNNNNNSLPNNEVNVTTIYDISKINSILHKFKNTTKLNIVSDLDVYIGTSIDKTTFLHKINFNPFTIYRLAIKSNRYEHPSVYEKVIVSLKIEPLIGSKKLITEVKEKLICQYDKQKCHMVKEMSLFHLKNGSDYYKYVSSFERDITQTTPIPIPMSNRRNRNNNHNNNNNNNIYHSFKLLIITILILYLFIKLYDIFLFIN